MFFSVPRFYEKLWEAFASTRAGRFYGRHRRDRLGRTVGPALGRAVLKRAGLDRCAQLIVGSAPCSDELLNDLRSLGIEVHNAYGLTEAPLISLNRVGRNRIGTVGEPLPETEVRISGEGEIEVRGRQVMSGYYRRENGPIVDGWLRTGDVGRLDHGYVIIEGRAKETMITSYGKNILPMHVETRLREIPGVMEAMLVADGRPYSTAILWVDPLVQEVPWDERVAEVGGGVSGPERPKAWAVLPYDLEVEKGDLTANLKLRRRVLMAKHAAVIDALYEEGPRPEGVMHWGREARRP